MEKIWEKEELESIEAQKFIEASRIVEKEVQFPNGTLTITNLNVNWEDF